MRRAQPWRTNRARVLRANATSAEDRLWFHLSNRQCNGLKFVRQASIGPYFADFVCREHLIVVEVDGATHCSDIEVVADRQRSIYFQKLGYRVFRVHNAEIFESVDGVVDTLLAFIANPAD